MLILKKPVDHSQYVLVDGSRGFTSTVSGVSPLEDYHLATKGYVDSITVSGGNYLTEEEILELLSENNLLGNSKSGSEKLSLGDISTEVTFDSPLVDANYPLFLSLENQVDSISSEYAITITDKTTSGFKVHYSGEIDSDNYYLNWILTSSGIESAYFTKQEVLALLGQNKSGKEQLGFGDTSTSVSFDSTFSSADYALLVNLENQADSPSSEYAITITEKTTTGFEVNYSGPIDSNNYYLNWVATLSGSFGEGNYVTSLIEDTSPQLGGDLTLGDYSVILNTTPSGNFIHGYTIGWSGEVSSMKLDDNNGFSSPLYMKSNGHMALCTAASGTTQMPCIAVSLEEGTGNKNILWKGIVRKGSWSWTPGDIIYVSTVEGALTKVKPNNDGDWQQSVGVAISADTIRFEPGYHPGNIKNV